MPKDEQKLLDDSLLKEYADKFFGFGSWGADVWFVGIEEAGGRTAGDVQQRLTAWKKRGKRDLEDAPGFYPSEGNDKWHGPAAKPQPTWRQLIRMLLLARANPDTETAVLEYQRTSWGTFNGEVCLTEFSALPCPNTRTWNYGQWSNLPWLRTRKSCQFFMLLNRAHVIQQRIEKYRPRVVVFYSSSWHRVWGMIARGVWGQAIQDRLMGLKRDGISYYVTRHPAAEADGYFKEIGEFLGEQHPDVFR